MHPADPAFIHRLVLTEIEERAFVGGGMEPIDTDVGLWVTGDGVLDAIGSPKLAWTRSAEGIRAGTRSIMLQEDPTGWQVGDALVVTPTIPPTENAFWEAYDEATIADIEGRRLVLSDATRFAHPAVSTRNGRFFAEVLNLTRNVQIEGTRDGRSHVWARSSQPQSVRFAQIRHMGPRRSTSDGDESVLGRYALHFHMSEEGARGSLVEGTVARDCGSHAFVAHVSHGVTFRSCISHNTTDDAYWWDPSSRDDPQPTDDVIWENCVASKVANTTGDFQVAGFTHGKGERNVARGCVAVGIAGAKEAAGFKWPPMGRDTAVWVFEDGLAHNNRVNGIRVWQNTVHPHHLTRFVGYHNGSAGISHGAYRNSYLYSDCLLHGNGSAGVKLRAVSAPNGPAPLRFERVAVDGAGITSFGFLAEARIQDGDPAVLIDCPVARVREAPLALEQRAEEKGETLEERFLVRP